LARVRLQSDLEENASALKSAMEQAKRSANDVAHMSDELRQEQDRNAALEKQRRLHETQIKELQVGPVQFLHSVLGWMKMWAVNCFYLEKLFYSSSVTETITYSSVIPETVLCDYKGRKSANLENIW